MEKRRYRCDSAARSLTDSVCESFELSYETLRPRRADRRDFYDLVKAIGSNAQAAQGNMEFDGNDDEEGDLCACAAMAEFCCRYPDALNEKEASLFGI